MVDVYIYIYIPYMYTYHMLPTIVSREGLASIVKAYSRLIPVDGLVL